MSITSIEQITEESVKGITSEEGVALIHLIYEKDKSHELSAEEFEERIRVFRIIIKEMNKDNY